MSSERQSPPQSIEGDRVFLKGRALDQAPELFRLIDENREHLRRWLPFEEYTKAQVDTEKYLQGAIEEWKAGTTFSYTIFEKSTNQMIGSIGFHHIRWEHRSCEVGYWVAESAQGKGYISEALLLLEKALADLKFHRVGITCDRLNQKSQLVPLRCGYKFEALQIDESIERGQFRDTLRFVKLLNPKSEGRVTDGLPAGYAIARVDANDFEKIVGSLKESVFDQTAMSMWPRDVMSDAEREKLGQLNINYRRNFSLHLIILYNEALAGWAYGYQETRESYVMANSVILQEHRGRGLYSALLETTLRILVEKGFQRICSSHHVNNSNIIVSKLKRGFVIEGTTLSEMAGVMVNLVYIPNKVRKKIFDFRVGQLRPDEDIKRVLKIQ